MKKIIKGAYKINDEIVNLNDFVEKNNVIFRFLIKFADDNNIGFNIGTSNKGDILCEYIVIKQTLKECKITLLEFKKKLKMIFKKVETLYEQIGDKLF